MFYWVILFFDATVLLVDCPIPPLPPSAMPGRQEIASTLGVAEGTVKFHLTNILSKLEVSARTEALVVAVQHGIIDIV